MGPFWLHFGTSRAPLGSYGALFARMLAPLGSFWPSGVPFGLHFGTFGLHLGPLGLHFVTSGAPFGTFWTPFWRHVAPSVPSGGTLAPQVQNEGAFWCPKVSKMEPKSHQKHQKTTPKKRSKNTSKIPPKSFPKVSKKRVLQKRFRTKNLFAPKGPALA